MRYVVALQKGGVAKTSTALAISGILGFQGKKVLAIDLDYQQNFTLASRVMNPEHTITDVLLDNFPVQQAIIHCDRYDLLAADERLLEVDRRHIAPASLQKVLDQVSGYDDVIIDLPPSLGNASVIGLSAADQVIIPVMASPFSIRGVSDLARTIENIKRHFNPNLSIAGILLVMYEDRLKVNRDLRSNFEKAASMIGTKVFKTTIRRAVAISESHTMMTPLIDYAPKAKVTQDYIDFVEELTNVKD